MKYKIAYSGWTSVAVEANNEEEAKAKFWKDGLNDLYDSEIQDIIIVPEFKQIKDVKTAEEAREIAIDWQLSFQDHDYSLEDLSEAGAYFEKLAEKFPELKDEFIENAII